MARLQATLRDDLDVATREAFTYLRALVRQDPRSLEQLARALHMTGPTLSKGLNPGGTYSPLRWESVEGLVLLLDGDRDMVAHRWGYLFLGGPLPTPIGRSSSPSPAPSPTAPEPRAEPDSEPSTPDSTLPPQTEKAEQDGPEGQDGAERQHAASTAAGLAATDTDDVQNRSSTHDLGVDPTGTRSVNAEEVERRILHQYGLDLRTTMMSPVDTEILPSAAPHAPDRARNDTVPRTTPPTPPIPPPRRGPRTTPPPPRRSPVTPAPTHAPVPPGASSHRPRATSSGSDPRPDPTRAARGATDLGAATDEPRSAPAPGRSPGGTLARYARAATAQPGRLAATALLTVLAVIGTLTALGLVFGTHPAAPAPVLHGQINPPEGMAPPGPTVRTAPSPTAPPASEIDTSQALTVQCAVTGAKTPDDAAPSGTTSWLRVGDQAYIPYLYVDVFTDEGPVVTVPNCDLTGPALSPGTYRTPAPVNPAPTATHRVFINNGRGLDAPVYTQPTTSQPPIKTVPHGLPVQLICATAAQKVPEDSSPGPTTTWLRTLAGNYIPSPYIASDQDVVNCDPALPALSFSTLGPG